MITVHVWNYISLFIDCLCDTMFNYSNSSKCIDYYDEVYPQAKTTLLWYSGCIYNNY